MIRLPQKKIYRAFPELDRFTEEECERFMLRVSARQGSVSTLPGLTLYLTVPLGGFAAYESTGFLFVRFEDSFDLAGRYLLRHIGTTLMLTELVFVTNIALWLVLLPAFVTLTWRDRRLRSALRRSIDTAVCAQCGQSLLGLPLLPGAGPERVRCPECGVPATLEDIGLTPDDLLVRER